MWMEINFYGWQPGPRTTHCIWPCSRTGVWAPYTLDTVMLPLGIPMSNRTAGDWQGKALARFSKSGNSWEFPQHSWVWRGAAAWHRRWGSGFCGIHTIVCYISCLYCGASCCSHSLLLATDQLIPRLTVKGFLETGCSSLVVWIRRLIKMYYMLQMCTWI